MEKLRNGISGFTLKWIAIITMMIDHVGAVLYPQNLWLREIGRISFPIFCFLLVEGALHTHNIRKYEIRLLLFALLSEFPYDLTFFGEAFMGQQNVFFTLFLGVVMIDVMEHQKNSIYPLLGIAGTALLAEVASVDYGALGILFILCFYVLHERKILKQVVFSAVNLWDSGMGIQAYACLAAVPMLLYNGKRGGRMKYFFYLFYPVHLLILYLIIR